MGEEAKNAKVRELPARKGNNNEKEPKYPLNDTAGSSFDISENALTVLKCRYLKKNAEGQLIESPASMFRRVAKHIAKAEKNYHPDRDSKPVEEIFYKMMTEFRFLPNSPTLMNAGRRLGQLAACFVLPVEDSMEAIFQSLKDAAMIHKSGGGTGFSFSRLRAKNSRVGTTGGVASGPVSFMKIFNTATEQVKQGGTRRGANMAILRVDHPDIMEFIHCKKENGDLNNFNISVALTDTFMEALQEKTDYDLIDPKDGEKVESLSAEKVYNALVKQAWENGDPGIVFIDRINQENPTPLIGEIESTNPCVTKDTFVMTSEGPRQVEELVGRQFHAVINGNPYLTTEKGFFSTGRKKVFRLSTKEGYALRLTKDHPVLRAASVVRNSLHTEWVRAEDLENGDRIVLGNHREFAGWSGKYGAGEGYLTGLLVGDGTLKKDKAVISVWRQKQAVNGNPSFPSGIMEKALACAKALPARSDFRGWQEIPERGEFRMSLGYLKNLCLELGMAPGEKTITPDLETCSSDFCKAFLSGLFDVDGSVQGSLEKGISLRLSQSDLPLLEAVQRMLLRFGIAATIYTNKIHKGESILPNEKCGSRAYPTRAQHELLITKDNICMFRDRIGFHDLEKQARLEALLKSYTRGAYRERFLATVSGFLPDCEEEVFDVQVPGDNCFDANGLVVHNCGEQPLLPREACNLGSVNLAKYVAQTEAGPKIDREGLKELVKNAVRFLDNTIDMSRYPLPEITEMVRGNRKVGLGVMGFADMLFQLGIPYNSEEALETAETLMEFIRESAWEASRELAEERGVFANFDKSIFKDREDARFRNATTTTIAPTGTLSIIAGCSSGIEPLFALSFIRNVMDDDRLLEVNPWFEAVAKERGFYSDTLMKEIASRGSIQDIPDIPDDVRRVFVTAHDVTPEWHIRMQAAFQKYTDNAVSKTVNMPGSATVEDVRRVYDLADSLGCKGVTIYRDGSKEKQVLSFGQSNEQERFMAAVKKRPETLPGFTSRMKTGLGSLYVTVTEYEGKPFEVFAIIGKSGRSTTAKTEAIGRLVSLALRAGVNAERIVEQLKGIGGEHPVFQNGGLVLSIPDAIARVLENRYMKKEGKNNGKGPGKSLLGETCPDCGETASFEEGCMICHFCGYSKCG